MGRRRRSSKRSDRRTSAQSATKLAREHYPLALRAGVNKSPLALTIGWRGDYSSTLTRSIVACDPATGQCGIAVVSFPTGVPAVVPVGEPGAIVAHQAFPSFATARAIIDKIKAGKDAPTALAGALAADPDQDFRQ